MTPLLAKAKSGIIIMETKVPIEGSITTRGGKALEAFSCKNSTAEITLVSPMAPSSLSGRLSKASLTVAIALAKRSLSKAVQVGMVIANITPAKEA